MESADADKIKLESLNLASHPLSGLSPCAETRAPKWTK